MLYNPRGKALSILDGDIKTVAQGCFGNIGVNYADRAWDFVLQELQDSGAWSYDGFGATNATDALVILRKATYVPDVSDVSLMRPDPSTDWMLMLQFLSALAEERDACEEAETIVTELALNLPDDADEWNDERKDAYVENWLAKEDAPEPEGGETP